MTTGDGDITLLTIDDDARLRRSLAVYFEDSGMRVLEAADGAEGLARCRDERVDIVLLDLNMPGLSGIEVVDRLAVARPGLPIVVVSGTAELGDAVEALHRGVCDFVTKPIISMAALEHTVRACLEKARLRRENEAYRLHLEQLVAVRTRELEQARQQILERLGRAAEFRDNETDMHVIRMSHYANLLALRAGVPEPEAALLLQAAPMHDIGKIGIPDGILLKPGKLDQHEWTVMQTHVRIGADIIGEAANDLMRMARTVILTHHEKWDGSGYPGGLAGADIPLIGRIVALADVYDALTSERPYKQAWPVERALELIDQEAGRHFDPALVPRYLEIVEDVRAIQERYRD